MEKKQHCSRCGVSKNCSDATHWGSSCAEAGIPHEWADTPFQETESKLTVLTLTEEQVSLITAALRTAAITSRNYKSILQAIAFSSLADKIEAEERKQ